MPGMAAKPVFDLQVSVGDLHQAEGAFDRRGLTPLFRTNMTPYVDIQLNLDRRLAFSTPGPAEGDTDDR
ncbi:hypothetical protein ACQPYK_28425 [Streptosporangium sp. CA-135522]|uniref:hypothetical protein n=1 Tax=Streptosporangium sp. CA-135522 TaxID=3240072 RepID=UPI003D92AAF2